MRYFSNILICLVIRSIVSFCLEIVISCRLVRSINRFARSSKLWFADVSSSCLSSFSCNSISRSLSFSLASLCFFLVLASISASAVASCSFSSLNFFISFNSFPICLSTTASNSFFISSIGYIFNKGSGLSPRPLGGLGTYCSNSAATATNVSLAC